MKHRSAVVLTVLFLVSTPAALAQSVRLAGDVVFLVKGRVAEHAPAATFFADPATEAARRFLRGDLVL